ncbi:MAG TPA: undecaprenyl-phosphate glucose phosphotransferase [Thermohalobaculum sp.]|nr:undecaprenyl-phosphate glucose phosphotransferase [Thermohalobaculum sp.]
MNGLRALSGEPSGAAVRSALARPSAVPRIPGPFAFSPALIPGLVLAGDLAAILAAGLSSWVWLPDIGADRVRAYVFCIAFLLLAAPALMSRAGLYEVEAIMRPVGRADGIAIALALAFLTFLTIAFSLKVSEQYSRLWIYAFGGSSLLLVIASRVGICRIAESLGRRGLVGRNVAVLGTGEQARRFLRRAGETRLHFARIGGVFDPDAEEALPLVEGRPVLGGPEALVEAARRGEIDDVVVALPWQENERLGATVATLRTLPVDVYIASDLIGYEVPLQPAHGEFLRLPLFEVVKRPIAGWNSVAKRVLDLLLGSVILVVSAPLLALIALAIRLDSPGPVLFRQARLGFNNRAFRIYKFRSMRHEAAPVAPADGFERQATRDDPRVTRVGRILRRTSLDELPQLLNVLGGSMSLVGPRPHALGHNAEYARQIRGYFARHRVKPGITGWAQVNGLRGETARVGLMRERVRHDTYYADNWSVLFDLRILVLTAFVVLFQKSAY